MNPPPPATAVLPLLLSLRDALLARCQSVHRARGALARGDLKRSPKLNWILKQDESVYAFLRLVSRALGNAASSAWPALARESLALLSGETRAALQLKARFFERESEATNERWDRLMRWFGRIQMQVECYAAQQRALTHFERGEEGSTRSAAYEVEFVRRTINHSITLLNQFSLAERARIQSDALLRWLELAKEELDTLSRSTSALSALNAIEDEPSVRVRRGTLIFDASQLAIALTGDLVSLGEGRKLWVGAIARELAAEAVAMVEAVARQESAWTERRFSEQ